MSKDTVDYDANMIKMVNSIKVEQYIKEIVDGFLVETKLHVVPPPRCYKVVDANNICNENTAQYKILSLEYIGNNIKLPEKAKIYYMNELMPYCQFKTVKKEI